MLKEALDFVFTKTKEAAEKNRAKIFELPGDGRTVVVELNGQLVDRKIPPPLRDHRVDSVADVIDAAKRWGAAAGTIWISEAEVKLVTDDTDRREFVTCPLERAVVFATAADLDEPLRHDLLAAVRKIKFKAHIDGESHLRHGGESLGRTIENEVTGLDGVELPDTLILDTNVFSNPGERDKRFKIALDLEIDAARQLFRLRPLPDEIERVTQAALCEIQARIDDALPDLITFFGRP